MIRFVDIGSQISLDLSTRHFAFYNTVTDKFVEFGGSVVWESEAEFVEYYDGDGDDYIERYLRLIPDKSSHAS